MLFGDGDLLLFHCWLWQPSSELEC